MLIGAQHHLVAIIIFHYKTWKTYMNENSNKKDLLSCNLNTRVAHIVFVQQWSWERATVPLMICTLFSPFFVLKEDMVCIFKKKNTHVDHHEQHIRNNFLKNNKIKTLSGYTFQTLKLDICSLWNYVFGMCKLSIEIIDLKNKNRIGEAVFLGEKLTMMINTNRKKETK